MSIELITILMFGSLLLLLFMGLPVAFACGTVGVIFTALLQGPSAVNIVPTRIFGLMTNYLLAAIPLFIFMACILERGGLIAEIYEMVHQWTGWLKGGVATATVGACAMMAAMVGVIGASVVTMGMIALPEMLKRGYDKYIASGCILAGGTLGILIPPSVLLIVYGMVDNSSIGQLYAGSFLPGFLLAGLFVLYYDPLLHQSGIGTFHSEGRASASEGKAHQDHAHYPCWVFDFFGPRDDCHRHCRAHGGCRRWRGRGHRVDDHSGQAELEGIG